MIRIDDENQREFKKIFDKLCRRFRAHEIWRDMIIMTACAISNSVGAGHVEQREREYMDTIKKYAPEEQELFPHLFNRIVMGMEQNEDQDFLGELYMIMGLGNDAGGQFFTPFHLCRLMAEMDVTEDKVSEEIEKRGYITVNDPACGAGATLLAAAYKLKEIGYNYQRCALFTGQDVDYVTALMCYIQLSLRGCAGYVHIGDTLKAPMTENALFGDRGENTWYTPMYFSDLWQTRRIMFEMGGRHETGADQQHCTDAEAIRN